MALSDIFGGAASMGASGAGMGAMTGNPFGVAIGAGAGALLGGTMGFMRGQQKDKQKAALGQARLKMEELARNQRAQRQQDLQKALSFFEPAQAEMSRLYAR